MAIVSINSNSLLTDCFIVRVREVLLYILLLLNVAVIQNQFFNLFVDQWRHWKSSLCLASRFSRVEVFKPPRATWAGLDVHQVGSFQEGLLVIDGTSTAFNKCWLRAIKRSGMYQDVITPPPPQYNLQCIRICGILCKSWHSLVCVCFP